MPMYFKNTQKGFTPTPSFLQSIFGKVKNCFNFCAGKVVQAFMGRERSSRQENWCRGFTLIELLVVIAIIGTLASVVLASLNTAREKARNSAMISTVKEVEKALQLYWISNNGNYPNRGSWDCIGSYSDNRCWGNNGYSIDTDLNNDLSQYINIDSIKIPNEGARAEGIMYSARRRYDSPINSSNPNGAGYEMIYVLEGPTAKCLVGKVRSQPAWTNYTTCTICQNTEQGANCP